MPVDAPKLPDLVLEMDAENQAETTSTNTRKKQDNGKETDNAQKTSNKDTGVNIKGKENEKDVHKSVISRRLEGGPFSLFLTNSSADSSLWLFRP